MSDQNTPAGPAGTPTTTTNSGAPVSSDQHSLGVGADGPLALHDHYLVEKLAQFNRERVPERVVHAKGGGAFGTFTVTHDISEYTRAAFLQPGKQTEMLARFSSVAGEQGSPDTWRDPRGFALKFYTEEGNYDLVGNNTPVFFIRDGIKFPDFIRSQKRLPGSHLRDHDMQWDFWTLSPESAHQVTWLMGDRGLPASWREMDGFGSHTYQWINAEGERFWVKYHFITQQGHKTLTQEDADRIAGEDADFHIRDLHAAIEREDFPKWTLKVQVMPYADAESYRFNPFDLTKVWPHADYPLIEVGELELNRNPENYFAQIEQATFAPSNFVPGIAASPDKMLLARIFSYADAHRYRVGTNHAQLPVNAPEERGALVLEGRCDALRLPEVRGAGVRTELARWRPRRPRRDRRGAGLGVGRRAPALRGHAPPGGRRLRPGRHALPRGPRRRRARAPRRQHRRTRLEGHPRRPPRAGVRLLDERRRRPRCARARRGRAERAGFRRGPGEGRGRGVAQPSQGREPRSTT